MESNKNSFDLTIFQFVVKFITMTRMDLFCFLYIFLFSRNSEFFIPLTFCENYNFFLHFEMIYQYLFDQNFNTLSALNSMPTNFSVSHCSPWPTATHSPTIQFGVLSFKHFINSEKKKWKIFCTERNFIQFRCNLIIEHSSEFFSNSYNYKFSSHVICPNHISQSQLHCELK